MSLTVIRSTSVPGAADSEYGCEDHHSALVRNRQRKNCPGSAASSSRCLPPMYTEMTPGPSLFTPITVYPCRANARNGTATRYHSTRTATVRYMADHQNRAARLLMNDWPTANWWLNASAMAR